MIQTLSPVKQKLNTVIIGKTLANAISPKPSRAGSRPGTTEASPNPKAATIGTVTVEVVTPPESYAKATRSFFTNMVWQNLENRA